ncbi:hypothetical protein E0L36_06120 [Streptomyces sp. AJS327]|uniref:alpha/beta hydrolase n=1 Tax=Streptomyces sp. AJS327 TaxID=2545265 RepID=UPI0015DE064D|nr:hypothetical protein [Streptomyces sp. AJS327]MBA0050488.1 hypothetical protein [Streptomyces sp. AJS327]
MRTRTAAGLAATSVLGAGAVAVAASRYAADAALRPARPRPGRAPLPAGFDGPALTVHAATEDTVTLTRSLSAGLPGRYGLVGRGCHAVAGPVLEEESAASGPDTVVRELRRVLRGELTPGTKVRITPQIYAGDPGTALGLPVSEVRVPGELGPLPAWFVPGDRDTWVLTAHGLGATREAPLALVPFLHAQRFPVLNLAYRGDPGAPRPPENAAHLGGTEWRDLDSAIHYALRSGAERVILYGWSSGATMALHAAVYSALRGRISGLVLDSPVLDLPVTLRALAAERHVPRRLLPLAVRAALGRVAGHAERVAAVADPALLNVPLLLVHGPDDTIAPWGPSRTYAAARPELVSLHTVDRAPHAAMWNAGPGPYEETLRRFLTPLM